MLSNLRTPRKQRCWRLAVSISNRVPTLPKLSPVRPTVAHKLRLKVLHGNVHCDSFYLTFLDVRIGRSSRHTRCTNTSFPPSDRHWISNTIFQVFLEIDLEHDQGVSTLVRDELSYNCRDIRVHAFDPVYFHPAH